MTAQDGSTPAYFPMTDLEEQLLGPDREAVRGDLLARLQRLDAAARAEIESGAPPARFDALQTLRAALAAARAVVLLFPQIHVENADGNSVGAKNG